MKKLLPLLPFLIAVTIALLAAFLTAAFWSYTQDDVFITYTYSRNIALGNGFVFYPGERIQGTTTPLYALLMAGVYRITPDLLHAGNLLSALFLLAACALVTAFTRQHLSGVARAAVGLILVTSPLVYVSFGMETLFYTMLLMLSFFLWERGRRAWAFAAAAALTWTRADGLVLGAALGLLALLEAWQRRQPGRALPRLRDLPWKLALIYLAGIAPWFLFAWWYFGTPLPNTFSAKQELLQGLKFWVDGWGWWRAFYGNNWLSLLAAPLILAGIVQVWKRPALRPLAVWPVLFSLGYTLLNVSAFWYYTALLAVLIVLAAFGGDWAARRLVQAGVPRRGVLVGGLALVVLSAGLAFVRALPYGDPPPRVTTYRLLGEWIEKNTEPDATILVGDLGIVGYYARRSTLDVPGLIVPDMLQGEDGYAISRYRPDYVIPTQYYTWQRLVEQDWFHLYYVPVMQISTPGDEFSPMAVYRRIPPVGASDEAVQGLDVMLQCEAVLEEGQPLPDQTTARLLAQSGDVLVEVNRPFLEKQYPAADARLSERLPAYIPLPLDVPPGEYAWTAACGAQQQKGSLRVLPFEMAEGYVPLGSTRWENLAALQGAALPEGNAVWSGGSLLVALNWQALGTTLQDYSVFVHLVAEDGSLAAQSDGYPRGGMRPTTTWQAGETIIDVHRILLPPDLPEGVYRLRVGWYDWRTGERLLAEDGEEAAILPLSIVSRWPGGSGLP